MKLMISIFLMSITSSLVACELRPLSEIQSLRTLYGLEELLRLHKQGSTKLFMFNCALAHDDLEALKILFSCGKNNDRIDYKDLPLSQSDRQGAEPIYCQPLHLTAEFGSINAARFCLEHSADINGTTTCRIPTYHKNTPAHIAVMLGKHALLSLLIEEHNARLDLENGDGKTIEALAQDKTDEQALSIINRAKNKAK